MEALVADLEQRAHLDVWFDRDLHGGQDWWDAILAQIRSCELFLIALSPDSLRSKACMSELDYAVRLNLPLLPVKVADLALQLAPAIIAKAQIVDYRTRSPEAVFDLMSALARRSTAPALPAPLPHPPSSPLTYMGAINEKIGASTLSYRDQIDLVTELRRIYFDDPSDRDAASQLLRRLRQRPDLAEGAAREIEQLLSELAASSSESTPTNRK